MFELAVLCEVFGIDRTDDGVPAFDFRVCAEDPAGARTKTGMDRRHPPARGGAGCRPRGHPGRAVDGPFDPEVLDILRDTVDRGARVLSVCSGAFGLGAAGLLDGRDCATHWRYRPAARSTPRPASTSTRSTSRTARC